MSDQNNQFLRMLLHFENILYWA